MSEEIVFYHNPMSRAQMAHWMLEEVGAPYRTVILDLQKGENKTPEFLAVNPMGKIPTIVHRDTIVTETAAIIAYLADAFPEAGLAPALGDAARGSYFRWLFFGSGCIEPALLDKMMKRPAVEQKAAVGHGSYEDVLGTLKTTLGKTPYLLGNLVTGADIYVGSLLNYGMMFGAPDMKGDPIFDDYVARLTDRPAYRRSAGEASAAAS